MKIENYPVSLQGTEEKTCLADKVKKLEETCSNCHPLTPITCITDCKIWKQKNEFRMLHAKMKDSRFMANLLNTIKNRRRLQILETISKGRYSTSRLQQELKKLGYYHSQQTIAEEYLTPLIKVGLAEEDQSRYYATLFGCQLGELTKNFNAENVLPPHSECYEETVLIMLLKKPQTYEDFKDVLHTKSVARVLNRLQKKKLIETAKENDYVFYFKTKRDAVNAKFSPTERKIYENILADGVPARRLAEKTKISLRRIYKYLKRLRGKKLVFSRKRPKSYMLTNKGLQIAEILNSIYDLTLEAFVATSKIINQGDTHEFLIPGTYQKVGRKENHLITNLYNLLK